MVRYRGGLGVLVKQGIDDGEGRRVEQRHLHREQALVVACTGGHGVAFEDHASDVHSDGARHCIVQQVLAMLCTRVKGVGVGVGERCCGLLGAMLGCGYRGLSIPHPAV